MNKETYWKNFRIGEELNIAGRFIYNGLRCCHEMEHFYHEDEVFEMLYQLSVGIERLLKVAVVLIEHDAVSDKQKFEKSLITHNHLRLLKRITSKHPLNLSKQHNEFLQLLSTFYKTQRYGRYNIEIPREEDKRHVHRFIEKHLNIQIEDEFPLQITPNDLRIKKFFCKMVGKVSKEIYEVICEEAARLNIYTYEIRYDSKAARIFLFEKVAFEEDDLLVKELLLHFLKTEIESGHIGFLKRLDPLDFDMALNFEHVRALLCHEKKINSLGELEALYSGRSDIKARLEALSFVGNPAVFFDDGEDDELD